MDHKMKQESKGELLVKAAARGVVGWGVLVTLVALGPGAWVKLALTLGWWGVWADILSALDDARAKRGLAKLHDAAASAFTGGEP